MSTLFECHINVETRAHAKRGDAAVMSHIWEHNIMMEAEQDG